MTGPLQGCRPAVGRLLVGLATPTDEMNRDCFYAPALNEVSSQRIETGKAPSRLSLRLQIELAVDQNFEASSIVARRRLNGPNRPSFE